MAAEALSPVSAGRNRLDLVRFEGRTAPGRMVEPAISPPEGRTLTGYGPSVSEEVPLSLCCFLQAFDFALGVGEFCLCLAEFLSHLLVEGLHVFEVFQYLVFCHCLYSSKEPGSLSEEISGERSGPRAWGLLVQ